MRNLGSIYLPERDVQILEILAREAGMKRNLFIRNVLGDFAQEEMKRRKLQELADYKEFLRQRAAAQSGR